MKTRYRVLSTALALSLLATSTLTGAWAQPTPQTQLPTVEVGAAYTPPESPRQHINFNREWKFQSKRVTSDAAPDFGGALQTDFDDSQWTEVGLPHSFSIPYNMEPSFFVVWSLP